MAKIYYKRIKEGIMTLEEVPTRWKEIVKQMIEAEGYKEFIHHEVTEAEE